MVALLIFVVGNYISELCKQILRQTEINSFSWLKKTTMCLTCLEHKRNVLSLA